MAGCEVVGDKKHRPDGRTGPLCERLVKWPNGHNGAPLGMRCGAASESVDRAFIRVVYYSLYWLYAVESCDLRNFLQQVLKYGCR